MISESSVNSCNTPHGVCSKSGVKCELTSITNFCSDDRTPTTRIWNKSATRFWLESWCWCRKQFAAGIIDANSAKCSRVVSFCRRTCAPTCAICITSRWPTTFALNYAWLLPFPSPPRSVNDFLIEFVVFLKFSFLMAVRYNVVAIPFGCVLVS